MTDKEFHTVYEQYWEHARHNENQLWSFTRIWALVLTAILASYGTSYFETEAKLAALVFGILLSLLGLGLVYSIRKPFLIYFWTVDLIASNELRIPPTYRRLDVDIDTPHKLDKHITVSFVLFVTYALVAAILTVIAFDLIETTWNGVETLYIGVLAATLMVLIFYILHVKIKRECIEVCEEIRDNYEEERT